MVHRAFPPVSAVPGDQAVAPLLVSRCGEENECWCASGLAIRSHVPRFFAAALRMIRGHLIILNIRDEYNLWTCYLFKYPIEKATNVVTLRNYGVERDTNLNASTNTSSEKP